jgi:hypothetical protein
MLKLQLKLSAGGYASMYCCICQATCTAVISEQTDQSPESMTSDNDIGTCASQAHAHMCPSVGPFALLEATAT